MKRALDFLLRNWPLKLAAILLATMLYSGLVLSQNVRSWSGTLRVDPIGAPADAALVQDPDPVTMIRYRAPLELGIVTPDSFRATVNLAQLEPREGAAPQEVPVSVRALDGRIEVVDYEPQTVAVQLDRVVSREFPVELDRGVAPEGLMVNEQPTEPATVEVRGAASRIADIDSVVAGVTIDGSGLSIDREVEVVALDEQQNPVSDVVITPKRVRVQITVARQLSTRTLPVQANVVGQPPDGYTISRTEVAPITVVVTGAEPVVSGLETVLTEPIDVSGRTRDFETSVGFDLPAEASVVGARQARVSISISEAVESRTFLVAVQPVGVNDGLVYRPSVPQVAVVLNGPRADLSALDAALLRAEADVAGLEPGSHTVELRVEAPDGLTVLSVTPPEIGVTVEQPPTPSPSPRADVVDGRVA